MIAHGSLLGHLPATLAAVAACAVYAACWIRRPTEHAWPLYSWFAGVLVAAVATSPPVERIAERSFTGHMVQHLLFLVVSAPLLVWARPWRTVTRAIGGHRGPRVPLAVRDHAAVLGAAAALGFMVVVHLSPLYDMALRSTIVHDLEHAGFLLAGVMLWGAAIAPLHRRGPARVIAVFGTITGMSLLSMVLLAGTRPVSTVYTEQSGVAAALADQRNGATLMWVSGLGVTLPLLLVATWRWASTEDRLARRTESTPLSRTEPGSRGHFAPKPTENGY